MRNIYSLVVLLSTFLSLTAVAGKVHPVGKWCKADQESLCAGMEWGTGLGKCLHEKAASVSALCKQHHPKLFGATAPAANSTGE